MMKSIKNLDAISFPLNGVRLIEASAGTGKTYTLAALYVRLILGQGSEETRFSRALLPPEILVVTFTNAATLELRDRIRARLTECAQMFRGVLAAEDRFTKELFKNYPEEQTRSQAAFLLERAANWMDEAAIFTIHGWAQRMLKQHAFDSGSAFDNELETDKSDRLEEAARDYWRIFCSPIDSDAAEMISDQFKNPEQLAKWVKPLLTRDEPIFWDGQEIVDSLSPAELAPKIISWEHTKQQLIADVLECWVIEVDTIEEILRACQINNAFNNRTLSASKLEKSLQEMRLWSEQGEIPKESEKLLETLNIKTSQMKAKAEIPVHACSDLLLSLSDHLQIRPKIAPALAHAIAWIKDRHLRFKQHLGILEFDDLLLNLSHALARDTNQQLHQRIRRQFPVALIDEFQDTDPLQYRIFKSLYVDSPENALMMIGDPKQAIYSFRGADIHTYLAAQKDAADQRFNLPINFRSSEQLVDGVNALFEQAEDTDRGAFLFKKPDTNQIPFIRVKAQGRDDHFSVDGECSEGLKLMLYQDCEKGVSAEQFRRVMSDICAEKISVLLNAGFENRAVVKDRPVQASDFAVLVRSGREAKSVRGALDARGISSVYLSDKESIFETAEALDLWRWLVAVTKPRSQTVLLSALATPSLMRDPSWLIAVQQEEPLWEAEVDRFIDLSLIWRRSGILAMVRAVLEHYQVAQHLLQRPGGERSLTNLLQLAEILQQESDQLEGEQGLIRFLAEQILQPQNTRDQQVLRMESDASRVQVITLHKSKGLEYPLVFIPFGVNTPQPIKGAEGVLVEDPKQGSFYSLGKLDKDAKSWAELARVQEDMRLLYVGLTRPKYACWIGVAPVTSVHKCAFGQLLGLHSKVEPQEFCQRVVELANIEPIEIEYLSVSQSLTLAPKPIPLRLRQARSLKASVAPEPWVITSYSALTAQTTGGSSRASTLETDSSQADQFAEMSREPASQGSLASGRNIHQFYRGAQPGTYLHSVLERAAEFGFSQTQSNPELRAQALEIERQPASWGVFFPVLDKWLVDQLGSPFPLADKRFALIDLQNYKAEMEFWFSLNCVKLDQLDQLCSEAVLLGRDRPKLNTQLVNGMIKGFIDLVFEQDGKYWIADYKSNFLGPDELSYTQEAMAEAVLHSRYDLQLLIYLLALHRLMIARDQCYSDDPRTGYETKIGGAAYLFLRGIGEAVNRGVFQAKPDYDLIERLDQLVKGEGV